MFRKTIIILFLISGITFVKPAVSDIYMYTDSNGVVHFTNVSTSAEYKLYIKEKKRKKIVKSRVSQTKFDHIIKKAQKKYGVEFFLIKAIIKVESAFNPKAVSKKGAKGLMQIMPDNYKTLAVKDPFNPSQNIMGGTLYLKRMLKRYKYKLPLALAAYNAGPSAVDKYKRIPPYEETQNYVRKVMKIYSIYKRS